MSYVVKTVENAWPLWRTWEPFTIQLLGGTIQTHIRQIHTSTRERYPYTHTYAPARTVHVHVHVQVHACVYVTTMCVWMRTHEPSQTGTETSHFRFSRHSRDVRRVALPLTLYPTLQVTSTIVPKVATVVLRAPWSGDVSAGHRSTGKRGHHIYFEKQVNYSSRYSILGY